MHSTVHQPGLLLTGRAEPRRVTMLVIMAIASTDDPRAENLNKPSGLQRVSQS